MYREQEEERASLKAKVEALETDTAVKETLLEEASANTPLPFSE